MKSLSKERTAILRTHVDSFTNATDVPLGVYTRRFTTREVYRTAPGFIYYKVGCRADLFVDVGRVCWDDVKAWFNSPETTRRTTT